MKALLAVVYMMSSLYMGPDSSSQSERKAGREPCKFECGVCFPRGHRNGGHRRFSRITAGLAGPRRFEVVIAGGPGTVPKN